MYNYNNTKHSTILMKPEDANKSNENKVWNMSLGQHFSEYPLPKFKVSDTVGISKYKSVFTQELFKVVKVIHSGSNVIELEDLEGEPIIGKFCEEELSGVEKILKRKKVRGTKMVLVKLLGYDNKYRSWMPENYKQIIV